MGDALRAELADDPSRITGGAAGEARRQAMANALDDTREWVAPNGYRLSDRIWLARDLTRRRIDEELRIGIAAGENPVAIARRLEQFLNPDYAPRRSVTGRLIRQATNRLIQRPDGTFENIRVITRTPPAFGAGSYPARRLARTEITRAHGQATIAAAEANPFVRGLEWLLSNRHPKVDICDQYATRDEHDLGAGVYPPDQLPAYPPHPQCLCVLVPVTETPETAVAGIMRKYGLDAR
jgi:hypothetical protein